MGNEVTVNYEEIIVKIVTENWRLMKLFMKNSTWRGHLIKDPNIANFFSQSKSILITELRNESINCSMTLPNGEVVKSIEHSQEFFNGHS